MVEEYMLLANREVAKFVSEFDKEQKGKKLGMMYRVHDMPEPEKLQELHPSFLCPN